jgi:hypothetical protein
VWRGEFTIMDQWVTHRVESCFASGTTSGRTVTTRIRAKGIATFPAFAGNGEFVHLESTQAGGHVESFSEEVRHDTGCENLDSHSTTMASRTINGNVSADWRVADGTPTPSDTAGSFPIDARIIVGSDQKDPGQSTYVYDDTVTDSCPPIEDTTHGHNEQTGTAENVGAGPCSGCGDPAHGTYFRSEGYVEAGFEGVYPDFSGTEDCSTEACSCMETTEVTRNYHIHLIQVSSGGDSDSDGLPDADDNCPFTWNPDQQSTGGGIGDACAALP